MPIPPPCYEDDRYTDRIDQVRNNKYRDVALWSILSRHVVPTATARMTLVSSRGRLFCYILELPCRLSTLACEAPTPLH